LFFDESLESGDVTLRPGGVAHEWEGRLGDLHGSLALLEEVRGKLVLAPAATSSATSSAVSAATGSDLDPAPDPAEQRRVIAALESELRECREDLQRDEEIFSEKVNELNRFR
jgi:hypothetical protein